MNYRERTTKEKKNLKAQGGDKKGRKNFRKQNDSGLSGGELGGSDWFGCQVTGGSLVLKSCS